MGFLFLLTKSVPRIVLEFCSRLLLHEKHFSSLQISLDREVHVFISGSNEFPISPDIWNIAPINLISILMES
jgi:hypothetical protein